jgi:hypothetical protein
VFIMDGKLQCDLGVAEVVKLPEAETQRRWRETTPPWPIMHAVLQGVTRDQMMARHKSNHIQVVYTPNKTQADRACRIKAAALAELDSKFTSAATSILLMTAGDHPGRQPRLLAGKMIDPRPRRGRQLPAVARVFQGLQVLKSV